MRDDGFVFFKAMFSDKFTSINFIVVRVSIKNATHSSNYFRNG